MTSLLQLDVLLGVIHPFGYVSSGNVGVGASFFVTTSAFFSSRDICCRVILQAAALRPQVLVDWRSEPVDYRVDGRVHKTEPINYNKTIETSVLQLLFTYITFAYTVFTYIPLIYIYVHCIYLFTLYLPTCSLTYLSTYLLTYCHRN